MSKEQEDKKAEEIMDFRYSIIAELLNPYMARVERRNCMREKAKRQHEIPYSNRTRVSYECIKKWYTTFQRFGKEGLRPNARSDKGRCRVLQAEEAASFLEYLEKNPELTAKSAYRTLKDEGVVHTEISKSALSRLVLAADLHRQNRLRAKEQTPTLKFAFKYPLECVQADMMHAFEVPDEREKRKRAILLLLLDDATRRAVYGAFSFREGSLEFEYALRHVLLAHGRIGRLFVDYAEKKQMPKFIRFFFPPIEIALKTSA